MSDQYSYCTNCQAPLGEESKSLEPLRVLEAHHSDRHTDQKAPVRQNTEVSHSGIIEWLLTPFGEGKSFSLSKDERSGVFVGAVAGFVYEMWNAIYYWASLPIMIAQLTRAQPSLAAPFSTFFTSIIVASPIVGIIFGALLGFIFVKLRDRIPGRSIIRKSLAVSLIFVALATLSNLIASFSPILQHYPLAIVAFVFPILSNLSVGLLFGYLLTRRMGIQ